MKEGIYYMRPTKRYETDNHIAVDIIKLQAMLGVGKSTADDIGKKANAIIKVGRRKLYNVKRIQEYMDSITAIENEGDWYGV